MKHESDPEPTDEQMRAIKRFMKYPISLIVGKPGRGKTFVIKNLVMPGEKHLIVAGTGAAAATIKEKTGREAYVMSMIDFSPNFIRKYKGCVLIVDEGSTASIEATTSLLNGLCPTKLAILGDHHQLPCINATPLLNSLLTCGDYIPITYLTKNLRQHNPECGLAKTIDTMGTPEWKGLVQDDSLRMKTYETQADVLTGAVNDYDKNTQMLAFVGKAVTKLNSRTANVQQEDVIKIVCSKNLYTKDKSKLLVPNGCSGLKMPNGTVVYSNKFKDKPTKKGVYRTLFDEARCITVHKSQGSEYEEKGIVVISPWKGPPPLELIFTALSRWKNSMTLYGMPHVINAVFSAKFASVPESNEISELLAGSDFVRPGNVLRQVRDSIEEDNSRKRVKLEDEEENKEGDV